MELFARKLTDNNSETITEPSTDDYLFSYQELDNIIQHNLRNQPTINEYKTSFQFSPEKIEYESVNFPISDGSNKSH